MSAQRLVIVGGVAGGASAAARARRLCEDCEIILFERGPHVSFANCGLPYFVGGEIVEQDALLLQTPASLRARFNLDVRVRTEVVAIDRGARSVRVRELETGREYAQLYDALILSTGAAPLQPPMPGLGRPNHFVVRNIPDVEKIMAWSQGCARCRAVVVGGGYIGLEMTEQLRRRGFAVSVVEAFPQVMTPLDPEMAAWLHEELSANGVTLHLNDPVVAFEPPAENEPARASIVVLKSGRRLPADSVILGLGVKPEVGLARAAGLDIGERGGIRVNDYLQTTDPRIWAVGDAIEVRDAVTGQWSLIPLAGPANRQGRIAADNIFGRPSRYQGTLGTAILRLFSLTAARTGASEKTLLKAGIPFQALHLHPGSHAGYYPGAEPVALKILFSPDTGKLLGAQAVGRDGVDKRIDVLATALKAGMTVHELAELELAYAPPYGSAKDPVNLAGMAAQNVLAGDVRVAQWNEVPSAAAPAFPPAAEAGSVTPGMNASEISAAEAGTQTGQVVAPLLPGKMPGSTEGERPAATMLLLDVRRSDERARGFIPGSAHIPLDELRARLGELPRDREVVAYCQSGQRSYFACRLLAQRGFRVRNLAGSFRTWQMAGAGAPPC
ncbi:MAG: FAD-dependent oxidoreductase [Chloroflexi bacterium]|nr:FAD-dependent oxidoreductase [Chloroflexota bacterium]